ncbi:helix-turn-helix domain-containing protein [Candidatus Saccharibacteria bacterium]|nr:helix-turn-helix domain-containing protein [Candidatus Saccharibacteria bacterium]
MRVTKYTDDTKVKLLTHIREGRTVKDACSLVGISDMTLTRWRRRFSDFDADYLKAVESQWQNLDATKESGVRTYRRNTTKLRQKAEKQAKIQKMAEKEQELARTGKPLTYEGLRIRYGSIADDEPLMPCINPSNGFVEYLKRQSGNYVQFSCSLDAFRKSNPAWYRRLVDENSALDVGD